MRIAYYGDYVEPNLSHDLAQEAAQALELAKDPWCPPIVVRHLRRYAKEATALLMGRQAMKTAARAVSKHDALQ